MTSRPIPVVCRINEDGVIHERLEYVSFPNGINQEQQVLLLLKFKFQKFTYKDLQRYRISHSSTRKIVSRLMADNTLKGSRTKPKVYTLAFSPTGLLVFPTELEDQVAYQIMEAEADGYLAEKVYINV